MKKTYFIKGLSGEKSKKGKPYAVVTVMEVLSDDNGEKQRVTDLYAELYLPTVNELRFGDEVRIDTIEGDWIGSKPQLVDITLIKESPFEF